jgi:hypothetical protein
MKRNVSTETRCSFCRESSSTPHVRVLIASPESPTGRFYICDSCVHAASTLISASNKTTRLFDRISSGNLVGEPVVRCLFCDAGIGFEDEAITSNRRHRKDAVICTKCVSTTSSICEEKGTGKRASEISQSKIRLCTGLAYRWRIRIEGREFVITPRCVCCGCATTSKKAALTSLGSTVSKHWDGSSTTTYRRLSVELPYCTDCVGHNSAFNKDFSFGWALISGLACALLAVYISKQLHLSNLAGLIGFLVAGCLGIVGCLALFAENFKARYRKTGESLMTPKCRSRTFYEIVNISRAGDTVTFLELPGDLALEFVRQNPSKASWYDSYKPVARIAPNT